MHILIVEDETLIRNGITRVISQLDGFTVVGSVDDGETALEWLETAKELPDLIITDIFMKYIDGLELVGRVNKLYPKIKCALLSGYSDFQLAQKAINLKVYRYLTKPINPEELLIELKNIQYEILQEKNRHLDLLRREQLSVNGSLYIRDKLLIDLLEGRLDSDSELRKFSECFPFEFEETFLGGVIHIHQSSISLSQRDCLLYSEAVKNLFVETFLVDYRGVILLKDVSTLIFVLVRENLNNGMLIVKDFSSMTETVLGVRVSIGVGEPVENLVNLKNSITQAFHQADQQLKVQHRYPVDLEQKLRVALRSGETEMAKIAANAFIERVQIDEIEVDFILQSFFRLIISLEQLYQELNLSFSPPRLSGLSRPELTRRMKDWVFECINQVYPRKQNYNHQIINQVIAYIKENYADSSLTLQDLANLVSIHPNYLTQIFRKQTGLSCMQYLAKERMEIAKILLEQDNLKIYEIAEKVGYENPLYFSSYFKKWVGKNPSDYKEGAGLDA